uniref:EF-hand and coiled-coil domain containing 1 n=1 Tax=Neogobius melanostomus TaxID=47308 RepID=A0A8C6TV80_9GOBI
MDLTDSTDPYSRPARRTQWIVSTLAYHYGLDRGVENEIIVLATGLDQYLQEIFHHLDYQGASKIAVEDFHILCKVLGLRNDTDDSGLGDHSLPSELTFRHFHAKLCGYFSTKAGCQYENGRLLVCKDSEHIETQIRLRSPLKRREKLLSQSTLEEAEDRISKLEDENTSLRELIEDMRAALQSSDARCLALQVGLWKSHSCHKLEEGCFELWSCRETMTALEDCNRTLKKEQVAMRRKVEEARQALLSALSKVKELESQASHVPVLKGHVAQLQTQLQYYR